MHRNAASLLPAVLAACGAGATDDSPGPGRRPNVLLVTIESLRPDHVASFGGPRATCPNLDALAREGVVYPDAHSVTSWTLASHASLFTGLYPTTHRVVEPLGRLADAHTTLAERLAERGYQCAGVVSGPYLREEHNLHQGFELYDSSPADDQGAAHGDVTSPEVEAALRRFLLEERDPERPFFLFAYLWDPHYDYIPPQPHDRTFVDAECQPVDCREYATTRTVHAGIPAAQLRWVQAQYDGEIRWTDEHLGRVLDLVRELGLWDDTLVVVTADHGEEFFEHGNKGHKQNLHVEQVHVPLVVKYPRGMPTGRDERLVSLVDVVPTVLEVTGTRTPDPLQGRSLLAPPDPERAIVLELLAAWYTEREAGDEDEATATTAA